MEEIKYDQFYSILGEYLKAQLFYSALELDLFSYLDDEISAKELAEKTGYDFNNLHWILIALASENLINKNNDFYSNTKESKKYLSSNSETYIGKALFRRKEMMDLSNLTKAVRKGKEAIKENKIYNFKEIAGSSNNEFKLFRAKPFINTIKEIYNEEYPIRFLDLGGGLGSMSVEIVKNFPKANGIIFEEKSVAEVAEKFINEENLSSKIEIKAGDFLVDDIGDNYDLIIASGIFHFAKKELVDFLIKIKSSLKPDGYLLSITKTVSSDYQLPKGHITRWLSGYIKGLDALLTDKELVNAMKDSGFIKSKEYGNKGIDIYQKGK